MRFTERRPGGRARPMKVQRIGPAPAADVWRWVADMLKGSTPDVLDRLEDIKVMAVPEPSTAPKGVAS